MSETFLVLPRPGSPPPSEIPPPIEAPSEAAFVATFGNILPPASYLQTPTGRAAYYQLPVSSPAPPGQPGPIDRVLYVHGVQTPAIGLYPLASALSSRFPHAECVLVDLWGHGLTQTPIVPHDPPLFHGLLEALMDHLGWEKAHLVGYSFGGSTAATFTAAHPKRVASMVLVAPAGLRRTESFSEVQRGYLAGGEGLEEKARDWIIELLEGGKLVVPEDWKERVARGEVVAEAVREWQTNNHDGHVASVVGIFRDGGVMDKHAEFAIAAKTGIKSVCILGELDDLCTMEDLHQLGMQNVSVISQVGHGVVRQRVPEVAALIEKFWNEL